MATQLKDKGHPALQTVSADGFARLIEACQQDNRPSASLLKMIAKGKKSLQRD